MELRIVEKRISQMKSWRALEKESDTQACTGSPSPREQTPPSLRGWNSVRGVRIATRGWAGSREKGTAGRVYTAGTDNCLLCHLSTKDRAGEICSNRIEHNKHETKKSERKLPPT